MTLHFGHFARGKTWAGGPVVAISNSAPPGVAGLSSVAPAKAALAVIPPYSWVQAAKTGALDWEGFRRRYLARLDSDPKLVCQALAAMDHAPSNPLYCCWEKPGDPCHRRVLADWARARGYEVVLDPPVERAQLRLL